MIKIRLWVKTLLALTVLFLMFQVFDALKPADSATYSEVLPNEDLIGSSAEEELVKESEEDLSEPGSSEILPGMDEPGLPTAEAVLPNHDSLPKTKDYDFIPPNCSAFNEGECNSTKPYCMPVYGESSSFERCIVSASPVKVLEE